MMVKSHNSVCLWSNFGIVWDGDYDHMNVTGAGVMPLLVKITSNGCVVEYAKAVDNSTLPKSPLWNSNYPCTTKWANEQFTLWVH